MSRQSTGILRLFAALLLLNLGCGTGLTLRSLSPAVENPAADTPNPDEYWDEIVETIAPPPAIPDNCKPIDYWFKSALPAEGFVYSYGGKTVCKVQPSGAPKKRDVMACYLDNHDYSGATIALGDNTSLNLQPFRGTRAAGLAFWAKGGRGGENIIIGLLDDNSDGKKVQSRVALRDVGALDTAWKWFMIPLKRFPAKGKYWDEAAKAEVLGDVDWSRINEVRFSTGKADNNSYGSKPIRIYIDNACIIDDIPGYVDPDAYWTTFSSKEPDLLLHDFESEADLTWHTGTGPASEVKYAIKPVPGNGSDNSALAITYRLNDWCDVMYDYRGSAVDKSRRNWTRHWGIKLKVNSERPFQSFNLQITDAGNELYIASAGVPQGTSEVILPFKAFAKFPYYQPPEARHDGTFDLDNVVMIDIKPAGEGSEGTFYVDDIRLTNDRAVVAKPVVPELNLAISGDFGEPAGDTINEAVFGINAQHWDADLLLPATTKFVKAVRHPVVRFPGGLSADEYHWQEALTSTTPTITTDQFIDFCKNNGCEPMLTVNFGTGTPEEAAAWVKYVNITKKAGVRLWEIGNELYGSWHHNHCSAETYGKRSAEFITAMKNVDPSILVTVVWKIDGPWNKTVFEATRDIADGVNVHNYPQVSGEESDAALLASPRTLEAIGSRVRRQLSDYGRAGRAYQIWLTEWNSVDFNPGPQSLGIVNALFVADYLAMLAKVNFDAAAYWNIHNSMFEKGGDYGYLSRSDDPKGPNIPRLSYWAFKIAREHISGTFVKCASPDVNVSVYATIARDGSKNLLLINKHAATRVDATVSIGGFSGKATMLQLTGDSGPQGYASSPITMAPGTVLTLPAYSITALQIK